MVFLIVIALLGKTFFLSAKQVLMSESSWTERLKCTFALTDGKIKMLHINCTTVSDKIEQSPLFTMVPIVFNEKASVPIFQMHSQFYHKSCFENANCQQGII